MDSQLKAALRLELAIDEFRKAAAEARALYGETMQSIGSASATAGAQIDAALSGAAPAANAGASAIEAALGAALEAVGVEAKKTGGAIDASMQTAVAAEQRAVDAIGNHIDEELRLAQICSDTQRQQREAARALLIAEREAYAEVEAAALRAAETKAATARQTAVLSQSLAQAFEVTGVRSAEAIRAEILQVDQALIRLANDTKVSGAEFDRAWASGRSKITALRAEMSAASVGTNTLAVSAKEATSQITAMAAPLAALFAAQKFFELNAQFDSTNRALVQMTGSAELAAQELEYLKKTSNRLGLDVGEATKAYLSLTAATKGTALEGSKTKEIFEAVAGAMGVLGKGSDETGRALAAVSQMASKGTVAMEELRGQLGEALPGALQATAKGLGITTQELITMVSSGSVLAEDLLPALASGLKQMYGTGNGVDGLASSWARLKNSINETFLFVGNSGAVTALVFVLGQLSAVVRGATGAVELLGKIIGITFGAVAQFDWKHPIDSITSWKNAVKEAADDIQKRLDAATASSERTSAAHDQTAASATKSGEAAASAAPGFLAMQAAQSKANAESAKAIEQATKDLAAKKGQADAVNALSLAFGTEIEKLQTEAETAREVSDAMQKKADASRVDADLRAKAVVQMQLEIDKNREVSQAKKDSLEAAKKLAEGTEAEALKDQAAADAARIHAEALDVKSKAYGNNSAEIEKYREAMEKAKDEEGVVIARDAAHSASKKEVAVAHEKAAQAVALYRDALADAISKIDLSAAADRRKASLAQAALNVEKERLITMRDVATASGDSVEAARLDQRIRDIDIQMLKAQAAASRSAADSILIKVKAMTAELEASDMLTDAKKAELAQLISEAEAKKLDAEKSDILAERIRAVALATDDLRNRGAGAADGLTESLRHAADESDRLNSSISSRPSVSNGSIVDRDVSSGKIDWGKQAASMGLTGDDAENFAKIAGDYFNQQLQEKLDAYGGQVITSTRYANDYGAAIELARQQAYTSVKPTTMSAPAPAASKTVRVELNINGTQVDVDTTESAAKNIVAALQAAAARR